MSKYTITIQEYCQGVFLAQGLENDPTAKPAAIMAGMGESDYYEIVRDYIFPSSWTFYTDDSSAKYEFIKDFTDYFMYREIGQSSVEQFRHTLKTWLRREMGLYTQLYNSQLSDISEVLNTTDIWRTLSGEISNKTGTVERSGSTTYGKVETRNLTTTYDGSFTPGRTDTNNIVPLGSSTGNSKLSQAVAGGEDVTDDETNDSGTVSYSGTDSNGYTDTYGTVDSQDITEHRAGKENVNVADAVEKFRKLIIDLNSQMLDAMAAYGLFMLVW